MKCSLYNYPRFYDWYIKKLAGWIEAYRERELLQTIDQCIDDNEVVLDICCGTGTTCILLGKRYKNAQIIGIDINSYFLDYAEKKIFNSGLENVQLINQDITRCTRENINKNHIDIAICILGFSVIKNWEKAIDQIHSILNPGGKIIVMDLYIDTEKYIGKISGFLARLFFKAHHDRMILKKLRSSFIEIDTILIEVKPESKTTLYIFQGYKIGQNCQIKK